LKLIGGMMDSFGIFRKEGYLIISGGLTIHSFENNLEGFDPLKAMPSIKEFDNAVIEAAGVQDVCTIRSLHIQRSNYLPNDAFI
jgi:aromatic ring-opening dioxygenase catalytic subunit (LigB family)